MSSDTNSQSVHATAPEPPNERTHGRSFGGLSIAICAVPILLGVVVLLASIAGVRHQAEAQIEEFRVSERLRIGVELRIWSMWPISRW